MVGMVLVSHSKQLADGLKDLVDQATSNKVAIAAAGGTDDGSLGTSADRIGAAIQSLIDQSVDGVLVLIDLGSAAMSAEIALESCSVPFVLSNAPLVEGAVMAGVQASIGSTLDEVAAAALQAKEFEKVQS